LLDERHKGLRQLRTSDRVGVDNVPNGLQVLLGQLDDAGSKVLVEVLDGLGLPEKHPEMSRMVNMRARRKQCKSGTYSRDGQDGVAMNDRDPGESELSRRAALVSGDLLERYETSSRRGQSLQTSVWERGRREKGNAPCRNLTLFAQFSSVNRGNMPVARASPSWSKSLGERKRPVRNPDPRGE
jgi:hypothetical protein